MSEDVVMYEKDGFVGTITLNRPKRLNALNLELWDGLDGALDEAELDDEVRVLVLCGSGKCFSAGLDLSPENKVAAEISDATSAAGKRKLHQRIRALQRTFSRFEETPKPVIAAVHGHCIGGALELICACDIRVATEDARFSLPEAALAIIADLGGLQRLPGIVGPGLARELAFTCAEIDAQRALAFRLVNRLYPDQASMMEGAKEMAHTIASKAPLAVQGAKEVMGHSAGVPLAEALEFVASRSVSILPSEDLMEAFGAFVEKRPPVFNGR